MKFLQHKKSWIIFLGLLVILIGFAKNILALSNLHPVQKNTNILTVALLKTDLPPYVAEDKNGKMHGYFINIFEGIAKNLGKKVVYDRTSANFDEMINLVGKGKADLTIAIKNLPWARKVLFSAPFAHLLPALLISRTWLIQHGSHDYERTDIGLILNKSHDCRIGIVAGGNFVGYLESHFPTVLVKTYPNMSALFVALRKGEIDGLLDPDIAIKTILWLDPSLALHFKCIIFRNDDLSMAVAVNPKKLLLLNFVNQYIEIQKINADADTLLEYGKSLPKDIQDLIRANNVRAL